MPRVTRSMLQPATEFQCVAEVLSASAGTDDALSQGDEDFSLGSSDDDFDSSDSDSNDSDSRHSDSSDSGASDEVPSRSKSEVDEEDIIRIWNRRSKSFSTLGEWTRSFKTMKLW
jgi:hypothetical protein